MGLLDQLRSWWTKQSDPRAELMRTERKKTEAMAKRLDQNQRKDRKPKRETVGRR
ncbi:hypothetical protein Poly51_16840 [Rubripirellula tenax]|uniref:Uncharacterized protein n=1 Tax=Rubripirellula tenax TaxID=2528015 RepID=A0A5C6FFB9_9BACT|nr:hypothetical protein Poly51_16840 [Rubripirellula tenax]